MPRIGRRVSQHNELHPAVPAAKRVYYKVASPSGERRGKRSPPRLSESRPIPSDSGQNSWSAQQLQALAATTNGRWRPKRPRPGSKPVDQHSPVPRTPPAKRAQPVQHKSMRCGSGPRPDHGPSSSSPTPRLPGTRHDGSRLTHRVSPPMYARNQSRTATSSSSSSSINRHPSSSCRQRKQQSYAQVVRGEAPVLVRHTGGVRFRVTFHQNPTDSRHSRGAFRHPINKPPCPQHPHLHPQQPTCQGRRLSDGHQQLREGQQQRPPQHHQHLVRIKGTEGLR